MSFTNGRSIMESKVVAQVKKELSGEKTNYGARLAKRLNPTTPLPYHAVESAPGITLSNLKIKWKQVYYSR